MDRRAFLSVGLASVASAAAAENPFVAEDSVTYCNHPFIAEPDPVAVVGARKHALIEFYTRDGCPPCDAWKRVMKPKVEKVGWDVQTIYTDTGSTPRFVLWEAGKVSARHTGYMSVADMKRILNRECQPASNQKAIIYQGQSSPSRACPNCPPNIRGYRATWTYPGSLKRHLAGSPHYLDTTGWTMDQMEYAHDQHHNRMRRYGGRTKSMYAT